MGIGVGTGESKVLDAARQAIMSPLLDTSIQGAKGIIFNITGDKTMGLSEIEEAIKLVQSAADPSANIFIGADINENLDDEVHITVIATGFGSEYPIDGETVVKAPQNRTTASVSGTANLYGSVISENKGEVKPPKAADWFGDKLSSMKTPEAAAPVPQDLSFLEEDEPEIPVFLKKAPKRTPRG